MLHGICTEKSVKLSATNAEPGVPRVCMEEAKFRSAGLSAKQTQKQEKMLSNYGISEWRMCDMAKKKEVKILKKMVEDMADFYLCTFFANIPKIPVSYPVRP